MKTNKGDGFYICGAQHGYVRCHKMKNLVPFLHEWKQKEVQEQGQNSGKTQLGIIGLCGAIAKHNKNPNDFRMQYVDISLNGHPPQDG